MLKAIKNNLLAASFMLFSLTSCNLGGGNRLPKSIGQPYEVIVEGDTDSIITQILTKEVPYLPQPEPLCKVIHVKRGKCHGNYSIVRTRVVVDVNSLHKRFAVKVANDVNATPQKVIYIQAESAEQLRSKLHGEKLRQLVDEAETRHLASRIKPNKEKQQLVKQMFGIEMKLPTEMDASKKAKDFLWISNNASTGMKNLIFMKANSNEQIDSLLRRNMVGETDSMYMVITLHAAHGLWEMKGDAMGGPYVMKAIKKKCLKQKSENIVVIGFVYAPEMKKKILIKQLEAAISTIQ